MPRPAELKSISLRLPAPLLDAIDKEAVRRSLDRSALIRTACNQLLEGGTPQPAPTGDMGGTREVLSAMELLLERVEALEKTCRVFAAFMDDGNERLAALEGTQVAVEAPASGLLERLMNARPAEG